MLQPGNIALERLYSQYFYESVGSHMILDPRISPSWSFLLVVENNLTLQACDDTTKAAKSTKKWRHGTFPRAFAPRFFGRRYAGAACACISLNCLRISYLRSFPDAFRGSESTKTTFRGILYPAMWRRQKS